MKPPIRHTVPGCETTNRKPPNLTGIDAEAFGVVQDVCEKLLATGAEPMKGLPEGNTRPIMIEKLVEYFARTAAFR